MERDGQNAEPYRQWASVNLYFGVMNFCLPITEIGW